MANSDKAPAARTACVVVGAAPEQVAAVGTNERTTLRANKLGTLVAGRPGENVIDYAAELTRPVYGVMQPHDRLVQRDQFPRPPAASSLGQPPGTNPGIRGSTTCSERPRRR
jgi:hypothetical protein